MWGVILFALGIGYLTVPNRRTIVYLFWASGSAHLVLALIGFAKRRRSDIAKPS